MSFLIFVILVVFGLVLLNDSSLLTKAIGVLLLFLALNPLCISLTGKSIPAVCKTVWNTGEKAYNATNKGLKKVGDTVSNAVDTVKDKTGK